MLITLLSFLHQRQMTTMDTERRINKHREWLIHGRSIALCLLAFASASHGEAIVREQKTAGVPASIPWFVLGVAMFILGIWGTYRRARLPMPVQADMDGHQVNQGSPARPLWRWGLTALALACGIGSMQLLRADWLSMPGTLLYLASMGLLVAAWLGEKVKPLVEESTSADAKPDAEASTDWKLPIWVEVGFVLLVCVVALGSRVYGLEDLTWGMHGDEGEAGGDALSILNGNIVSPFTTGWFAQPNVYYWSVAIGLEVFGLSLTGLRMSAVAYSMLIFPFFYLLVRRMFGVRAAFIGLALLGVNTLFLHYSRVQFSNITTPVFWTIGFYFLVRGFHSQHTIDFVLSAFAAFFSLYFYNGARIIPFIFAGLFSYMALFQRGFLRRYFPRLIVFGIAAYIVSAPFVGYYLDNQSILNSRSAEKLIYNNPQIMKDIYGEPGPVPLLGGLQFTPSAQVYYFWGQLNRTLSMFTYRRTESSIFGFTGEPVVNFVESVFLILGIAVAAWRWRDPRFALLSVWFWAPTIAGGVLTIEAPYTDRLVGIFPVLVIFMAIVANKIVAEGVALWRCLPSRTQWLPWPKMAGSMIQAVLLLCLVGSLGQWNMNDYFGRAMPNHWRTHGSNAQALAQAQVVQQRSSEYKFYEIGETLGLNYGHGITKFMHITRNADGRDMVNLGGSIPLQDSNGKDVYFIINNGMVPYLEAVKAYYPVGHQEPYMFNNEVPSFISYILTKEQIADTQRVNVSYKEEDASTATAGLMLKAPGIGTRYVPPPANALYPLAERA